MSSSTVENKITDSAAKFKLDSMRESKARVYHGSLP